MAQRSTNVASTARRISKNLRGLKRDLAILGRLILTAARGDRSARSVGSIAAPVLRRRRLSAEDRARLRIQGEYLGLVRHLSTRERTTVKALRSRRGYGPALAMARRLAKRGTRGRR